VPRRAAAASQPTSPSHASATPPSSCQSALTSFPADAGRVSTPATRGWWRRPFQDDSDILLFLLLLLHGDPLRFSRRSLVLRDDGGAHRFRISVTSATAPSASQLSIADQPCKDSDFSFAW
jgi:hypothetical protein